MRDEPEHPTITEQASERLRAANLLPPVNSIATFDDVGVIVSGRDGITVADSVRITEALGSIPHQVVEEPRVTMIQFGSGENPEGAPGYAEFQAALHAQNFCTGYSSEGRTPGADGVTFTCSCGRLSGDYRDTRTANLVLDEHLDAQGRALREFTQNWWVEYRRTFQ